MCCRRSSYRLGPQGSSTCLRYLVYDAMHMFDEDRADFKRMCGTLHAMLCLRI